jgi:hypothetical protein
MFSSLILISSIVILYRLFLLGESYENKVVIFIFTIFYLIFFVSSYLFNAVFNLDYFILSENISIDSNWNIYSTSTIIISFYALFCLGNLITNYAIKQTKVTWELKFFNPEKTNTYFSLLILLISILLIFILFSYYFENLIITTKSYHGNVRNNFGQFVFLKELILLFLSLLILIKKSFLKCKILTFLIFVTWISFLTSDKDPLLFVLIFFYYYVFIEKKINPSVLNLLFFFLVICLILFFFLPFFSSFRVDMSFKNAYYHAVNKFKSFEDPGSGLSIIYLLLNDSVQLNPYSYFYNFLSFLPEYARINSDYGVDFAKNILKDSYVKGFGFSFNLLAEAIIYLKKNGIIYYSIFILFVGFFFSLSNYFLIKLFPSKYKKFILIYIATVLSFLVVRSTSAGIYQFIGRFVIIFFIILILCTILSKKLKKLIAKKNFE